MCPGPNIPLQGRQEPQASSPVRTPTAGTLQSWDRRVSLCNPIDGSPLGSTIPGILQARTLEWVAIFFSRPKSPPTRRGPPRATPRVPAPLPLSPFSPPDRDSPSQRPPRVQEGSQEPGSQEAAESAAQGPGPGLGRKGGGQAAGLRLGVRFLPATPPGGLHGSGPVPRAGPLARAVPPLCHHPLLPSPSLEGPNEPRNQRLLTRPISACEPLEKYLSAT